MSTPFPRLFSPIRLGPREARNRIVSTPHTTGFGVGGFPRGRWLAYEREKARGGAGTIMMFGSASVHPSSPVAAAGGVEYWDPAVVPHLRAMADAVHAAGGLCLAQVSPLSLVQEVGAGWVRLANTLTDQERTVEVDTVVTALGGRAQNQLERALEGRGLEVHVVGDALAPRTIHDAILTATRAARRI